jgi:mRNA interferase RelE/StbE
VATKLREYRVAWSATAHERLLALDKPVMEQAGKAVDRLAEDPRPAGAKALIGTPGVLRVQTSNYRVLFSIDDDKHDVLIEDVRHRSNAHGATNSMKLLGMQSPQTALAR